MNSPAPTSNERIQRLVAECLDCLEAGGPTAMEAHLDKNQQQADAVRDRLERLRAAGLLEAAPNDEDHVPERLGAFRLIERIGGGGMGVVYLAEDEILGRQVALKLVRPDLLFFEGARKRFRREVELVARLKHPGIVPVYSVGEAEGIPYYAMEFVEGRSLADILRLLRARDPRGLTGRDLLEALGGEDDSITLKSGRILGDASWVDACVQLMQFLAEALEHAHSQKVLHRDVKPSNVMLAADGRVLLLDFGLASSPQTSRLTRTGSQLGSLPYMAPEQLRCRPLDERTDIYAVGVTFFELLTLRLPYLAFDPEETRRLILEQPLPSLREWNPVVPRDVETVVQTAMDRDPARRYRSAGALAADLDALLRRRPIAARRPGPLLRARRLVQRKPAASVGTVLGALLFVGSIAFGFREYRSIRAMAAANSEKDVALENARISFLRSLDATHEMLRHIRNSTLQDTPGGHKLMRDLLIKTTRIHEELFATRPEDHGLWKEAAVALNWTAYLLIEAGDYEGAKAALDRSFDLLLDLRQHRTGDIDVIEAYTFALGEQGRLIGIGQGDFDESLTNTQEQLSVQRDLLVILHERKANAGKIAVARRKLATYLLNTAADLGRLGRLDEAEAALVEGRHGLEELLAGDLHSNDRENLLFVLLNCCVNQSAICNDLGRLDEAKEASREALALAAELRAIDPRPNYALRAIIALHNLALACQLDADAPGAVEAAAETVERAHQLAVSYPLRVEYRVWQVRALYVFGNILSHVDPVDAQSVLDDAVALAEELVVRHPDVRNVREQSIHAIVNLTRFHLDQDRSEVAEALARSNLEALNFLLERWPGGNSPRPRHSTVLSQLAEALLGRGQLDKARELAEQALATRDARLPGLSIDVDEARQWSVLARIAAAQGDHERSLAACREASSLFATPWVYRDVAGVLAGAGEKTYALDLLERAVDGGYNDAEDLSSSSDFASLRQEARFEELMARAEGSISSS